MDIRSIWEQWADAGSFSGVFSVRGPSGVIFEQCAGMRNRSEALPNNPDTAFGIASGTKLFTGITACKLLETGKLKLTDRLWDILPYDLGQVDKRVTVWHLLTHTSGVGDYLDEEAEDVQADERALCAKYPVYLWEQLSYYLQMIAPLPPKFEPGARYGYSNAGYVLLGLAIEQAAGKPYRDTVADMVIRPLGLRHTGFYRMDALPANTAHGYLEENGAWRANVFSLPVLGGSDGGLYTCAADMDALWRALFDGRLLTQPMREAFLKAQVRRDREKSYGLGVYRLDRKGDTVWYALGGDFGVDFFSACYPSYGLTATALGNTETDASSLLAALNKAILR